jgi:hypothetical protein
MPEFKMGIEPTTPTVQNTVPSSPPLYRVIFLHYFVNVELHLCCQFGRLSNLYRPWGWYLSCLDGVNDGISKGLGGWSCRALGNESWCLQSSSEGGRSWFGDFIGDDVNRDRFSHKRNAKMVSVVRDNLFWPTYPVWHLSEITVRYFCVRVYFQSPLLAPLWLNVPGTVYARTDVNSKHVSET